MTRGRTVMVTGVSRYLGGRVARALASDPSVDRVIGVDVVPPRSDIGRTQFVRLDLRTPMVTRVVATHQVTEVVHAGVLRTSTSAGGRAAMKEINVLGTMQLIAACQRVESVQRFVLKSTTAVYGSGPGDPAMFRESDLATALPRSGFARDSVDVEDAARRLMRQRPDIEVAMVRLANVMGPGIVTPLSSYFSLPVIPTVLGFDPRIQLLHEDDAVEALRLATVGQMVGPVNVAGDGVMMLSQAIARAGRLGLPLPAVLGGSVGSAMRRFGLVDFAPEDVGFLSWGRGVDTTLMRRELGLEPAFTTRETFDSFLGRDAAAGPRVAADLASAEPASGDPLSEGEPDGPQPRLRGVPRG